MAIFGWLVLLILAMVATFWAAMVTVVEKGLCGTLYGLLFFIPVLLFWAFVMWVCPFTVTVA